MQGLMVQDQIPDDRKTATTRLFVTRSEGSGNGGNHNGGGTGGGGGGRGK